MRSLVFSLLIIVFSFTFPPDLNKDIINAIENGNVEKITKYFADNVNLEILTINGIYSKEQSYVILSDFFKRYKFHKVVNISKTAENRFITYIYSIQTIDNQVFLLFYKVENNYNLNRIITFRIIKQI